MEWIFGKPQSESLIGKIAICTDLNGAHVRCRYGVVSDQNDSGYKVWSFVDQYFTIFFSEIQEVKDKMVYWSVTVD